MYKVVDNPLPLRLLERFQRTLQVHTYILRASAHNFCRNDEADISAYHCDCPDGYFGKNCQGNDKQKSRTKQLVATMYKVVDNPLPLRLLERFQRTLQVHTYILRASAHNFCIPRPLSEGEKQSLHYRGTTLWNSLPTKLEPNPRLLLLTLKSPCLRSCGYLS